MKILTGAQIHELDQYTIDHEPVASIELMERAARAITSALTTRFDPQTPVVVFAGPGTMVVMDSLWLVCFRRRDIA